MVFSALANVILLGAATSICEYIFRLGLAVWEYRQKHRLYPRENRIRGALQYSFHQDIRAVIAGGTLFGLACSYDIVSFLKTLACLMPSYTLLRALNYQRSLIDAANWIRDGSGIDYGTGMACNYFHGYINLQLADKGNGVPGIRERLRNYEAQHNVCVPVKRLFILIPASLHSQPKFSDSPHLEDAHPVEVVNVDRAGCTKRPFRTSVYRMTDEDTGEKWYAAMEGATPLQSFKESVGHELTGTPIMKRMEREIALQFYKALKKISESPEFRKSPVFEVIYYNDLRADGTPTRISDVVKTRIREMKRKGLD